MHDAPLFKNRYRVPSGRWQKWNYGWNGWYFVTICTAGRICYFGNIADKTMVVSRSGKIVQDCWFQIPQHFPFVKIDQFVVMPNHVHGIICIDKGMEGLAQHYGKTQKRRDAINGVSTARGGITKESNPMMGYSLGKVLRWLKGRSTHEIHQNDNIRFAWQDRFHDRVIRDEFELGRIRKYVRENPEKWEEDELYSENIAVDPSA